MSYRNNEVVKWKTMNVAAKAINLCLFVKTAMTIRSKREEKQKKKILIVTRFYTIQFIIYW